MRAKDLDDSVFKPVRVVSERVDQASPGDARNGYVIYRGEDGFEAAFPKAVIERCVALGRAAAPLEWCGLLIGRLCEHEGARHVVVLGVVPFRGAIASPHTVETTHDSEYRTRAEARFFFPDGIILGWAHGHLDGHGVRFSSTDLKTQATWTQPHSLGVVVNPWHADILSVYRGPQAEFLKRVDDVAAVPPSDDARLPSADQDGTDGSGLRGRSFALLAVLLLAVVGALAAAVAAEHGLAYPRAQPVHHLVQGGSSATVVVDLVELQDRVYELEEQNATVVPGLLDALRVMCVVIVDNPSLIRDEFIRDRVVRSCAGALAGLGGDTDPVGEADSGVCTRDDASVNGALW